MYRKIEDRIILSFTYSLLLFNLRFLERFSLDCSGYPCLTTRLQRLSPLWYRVAGTQRALVAALVGRQDNSGKRD